MMQIDVALKILPASRAPDSNNGRNVSAPLPLPASSANTHNVLAAAGIADLFEQVIDAPVAEREHLAGKPAPDTYLAGARALGPHGALRSDRR